MNGQDGKVLLDQPGLLSAVADRLKVSPLGYNDINSIADSDDEEREVGAPSLTTDARVPPNGVVAMWSFLMAILGTTRRWRDSIHGPLPGYKDRVVHIGQSEKEGGTNLEMDEKTIQHLAARGGAGARMLHQRFLDGEAWGDHRWTRARMGMAAVAARLVDLGERFEMEDHAGVTMRDFLALRATSSPGDPADPLYPWPVDAGAPPDDRIAALIAGGADWGGLDGAFRDEARPKPDLDVRIVPRS